MAPKNLSLSHPYFPDYPSPMDVQITPTVFRGNLLRTARLIKRAPQRNVVVRELYRLMFYCTPKTLCHLIHFTSCFIVLQKHNDTSFILPHVLLYSKNIRYLIHFTSCFIVLQPHTVTLFILPHVLLYSNHMLLPHSFYLMFYCTPTTYCYLIHILSWLIVLRPQRVA